MLKKKLERSEELGVNLRYKDRSMIREKLKKVDEVISKLETKNISETNTLILAGANAVEDLIQIKKKNKRERRNQEQWKKRRMKQRIQDIKRDITRLQQWKNGALDYKEHTMSEIKVPNQWSKN